MVRTRNPFTPAFGGRPQHFFGRTAELAMVNDALENDFSPYRALFITGNRGCGKTSMLEQTSERASAHRWLSVDVHAEDALISTVKRLAGGTEKTISKNLQPQAAGFSAGSVATSTSMRYTGIDLADVMLERLQGAKGHRESWSPSTRCRRYPRPTPKGFAPDSRWPCARDSPSCS